MRSTIETPTSWRFLNTGACTAAYNMAVDEAISDAVRTGMVRPTVRVYGWQPPAVSIGYAQTLEDEVDPARCRQYGIDIVRRQTGGRAVLHDRELTYSVIAPEGHEAIGSSAYENYRRVSEALREALIAVDIPCELSSGPEATPEGSQGACFSYAARFEIVVSGRKIVGSAQRRARGIVLQHGSLLLGPEHKRLPMLLPPAQYDHREALMLELDERTISVEEVLNQPITFDDMVPLVRRGFASRLGLNFTNLPLTREEQAMADQLTAEKYGSHEWTSRSKPRHVLR